MGSFAVAAQADPAGKWRVEFGSHADNDGTLTLRISPEGGAPVDVETKITAKSSAGKVAKAVRDSLRASLGEGYHVETDDGEDVVIESRGQDAEVRGDDRQLESDRARRQDQERIAIRHCIRRFHGRNEHPTPIRACGTRRISAPARNCRLARTSRTNSRLRRPRTDGLTT